MKTKFLTICLLLFTSQVFAETKYTCADAANYTNANINKLLKLTKEMLKERQLKSDTRLTRAYCDDNKDGNPRLNYVYNLNSSREKYSLDEKNVVKRELCSQYETLKILFNYATEVRYIYLNNSGKIVVDIPFFNNTCGGN